MLGLLDGERISMICSAVLTQYTRVTDGRTDGRTDGIGVACTRYSIYAVARKNRIGNLGLPKLWANLGQLSNLIAKISVTTQDIVKGKMAL